MAVAGTNPVLMHRLLAAPVLVTAGGLSLPLSAAVLDANPRTENLILPAQFGAAAGIGAATGAALPGIAGAQAGRGKGALVGVGAGIGAALIADLGWFAVIAG